MAANTARKNVAAATKAAAAPAPKGRRTETGAIVVQGVTGKSYRFAKVNGKGQEVEGGYDYLATKDPSTTDAAYAAVAQGFVEALGLDIEWTPKHSQLVQAMWRQWQTSSAVKDANGLFRTAESIAKAGDTIAAKYGAMEGQVWHPTTGLVEEPEAPARKRSTRKAPAKVQGTLPEAPAVEATPEATPEA